MYSVYKANVYTVYVHLVYAYLDLFLQKFQTLEEEHIAQMLLFTIKYSSSVDYAHRQSQEVRKLLGNSPI